MSTLVFLTIAWMVFVCGMLLGVYDLYCAVKNIVRGGYRPFRLTEFLFQDPSKLYMPFESPITLMIHAAACMGGGIWIFVSKLYPHLVR